MKPCLEMPFPMKSLFAEVEIFSFWLKSMILIKLSAPVILTETCYGAEIGAVLLLRAPPPCSPTV